MRHKICVHFDIMNFCKCLKPLLLFGFGKFVKNMKKTWKHGLDLKFSFAYNKSRAQCTVNIQNS